MHPTLGGQDNFQKSWNSIIIASMGTFNNQYIIEYRNYLAHLRRSG